MLPFVNTEENVCIDGFISFDHSQFFPNEITIAITSYSRYILDISHASHRRCGIMTNAQKKKREILYHGLEFEKKPIQRTFLDILTTLGTIYPPKTGHPLILVTDEKKEYTQAYYASLLFQKQDDKHRIGRITVSSTLPRTKQNPLFASNYLDREIRKDQANHRRETACFTRNASNGMARLVLYLINHNYLKRYSIKASIRDRRVHGEMAGIEKAEILEGIRRMFKERAFFSRLTLTATLERIWKKNVMTPFQKKPNYLPKFALA